MKTPIEPTRTAATSGTSTAPVRLFAGLLVLLAVATGLAPATLDADAVTVDDPVRAKGSAILLVDSGGLGPGASLAAALEEVFTSTGVLTDTRWMHHRAFVPSEDPRALVRGAGDDLRAVILVLGGLDWFPGVDPSRPPGAVGQRVDRRVDTPMVVAEIARWRLAAEAVGAKLLLATAPLGIGARIEVPEMLELEQLVRAAGCSVDIARHFRTLEDREYFRRGFDDLTELGREALVRFVYAQVVTRPAVLPSRHPGEEAARREARALHDLLAGDRDAFEISAAAALRGDAPTPAHALRRAAISLVTEPPARARARWAALPATEVDGMPPGLAVGRWLTGGDAGAGHPEDPVEVALVRWLWALDVGADESRSTSERAAALLVSRARLDELAAVAPHRLETLIARQTVAAWEAPPRRLRGEELAGLHGFDDDVLSADLARQLLDEGPGAVRWLPALLAASVPRRDMILTGPGLHGALRRSRLIGPGAGLRRLRLEGEKGPFPDSWIRILAESSP